MKKLLLVLGCVVICGYLSAQTPGMNSLAFPSPNNNFLSKLGSSQASVNVGVDQYTGTAQVNVGICNLASKELNVPVSLSYTAGRGVRVQDYATNVGLGWQLNAGGSITRVVRGFPDQASNGYIGGGWGNIVAGWTGWNATGSAPGGNLTTNQAIALLGLTSNGAPTADGEPDLYFVQTPFFSFQFVMDGNGAAQVSNSTGVNVSYNNTSGNFILTDDQGNTYYFGSSGNSLESSGAKFYGSSSYTSYTSTWYLDKIASFNTRDVINLTYQVSTANDTTYHYQLTEMINTNLSTSIDSTPAMTIIYNPKSVSVIKSSLGEVDFSYLFDRSDDHGGSRLTSIAVKPYNPVTGVNGAAMETFAFNYSYFGSPSTDQNILRLRLDNITIADNTQAMPVPITFRSFGYNVANVMPSRRSQAFDYWGYCSMANTNTVYTNPSDYWTSAYTIRQPNVSMAMTDILLSIGDVLGGTWKIGYEGNDFYNSGTSIGGGLRVNLLTRKLPTGETYTTSYSYVDAGNTTTGQIYGTYYNQLAFSFGNTYLYLSESPYVASDLNGNFVGYSAVKETTQNGGYTISTFTNFNDPADNDGLAFSDVLNQQYSGGSFSNVLAFVSSVSNAFKRGLLKDQIVYTAGGSKIYEITNTYNAQTNPAQVKAKAVRPIYLSSFGGSVKADGYYCTNIEDYRLTQSVRKDFDQVTNGNYVQTSTSYTYSPVNKRLVSSVSTTDSKGASYVQTYYHPDDTGIPMTGSEGTAIAALASANRKNVIIHRTDSRNGVIHQLHNTFGVIPVGGGTNTYLASSSTYTGSTLQSQQFFNYDYTNSNLISSNDLSGKPVSETYGYNASYAITKVVNASSSFTNTLVGMQGYLTMPPNNFASQQATFTTGATGTITISLPSGSYLAGGVTCYFAFGVTGPASGYGTLCVSSVSGYVCSGPQTVSFPNMPAGNYTLTVSANTNTATQPVSVTYGYQALQSHSTTEFFFEGFEQVPTATSGTAHTGNMYQSTDYTANFSPPNSRTYVIQWWSLVNGKWQYNEQPYTAGMVLPGPVDDIRIFPSDAQMTSYTYNPLLGVTSETDPSGKSVTYEYDGLGRLVRVRDQDNNILKQYQYQYQGGLQQ